MPERPAAKFKPHPFVGAKDARAQASDALAAGDAKTQGGDAKTQAGWDAFATPRDAESAPPYAELCVTSNFTFLSGASHPEEFVEQAAALGYRAIALTDLHTLAGVVRAHVAAKECCIQFVLGARLALTDMPGMHVCVYPTDLASYGRLCRLLTIGKRRTIKGQCELRFDDLSQWSQGLLAVALAVGEADEVDEADKARADQVRRLRECFDDDRLSLGVTWLYGSEDVQRLEQLSALSRSLRVPLVATNDVNQHHPDRRMLQDVLTCIRHGCTIAEAGFRLHANAERHLKTPGEMHRLLAAHPEALERTIEIAHRARGFNLDQIRYEYPHEVVPAGATPMGHLRDLVWQGAARAHHDHIPDKVRAQIEHELELIDELRYAPYFLTVHDLVLFARSCDPPILCQGRGAAANSAVCYYLGVTAVDPVRINLLFERFVSRERNEPPDIDIDFEHERREEVIQYIYRKYGRDRAALTAEVISYRRRSAVRDVGKALGLSLDCVDRLAKNIDWWDGGVLEPGSLREMGLNPDDPTLQWLARLVGELLGFPRHLSQHVGGFIMTHSPLCELVPVENAAMPDRTVVEWDKDDIDAMGMLKVDVLGLGMLSAIRRSLDLINQHHDANLSLGTIPPEDTATYEMIQHADTVGVFQIESRAQMSMLPRLKPKEFYDLVIEVAIVRPGPIQGDMVHPYLRRRSGQEAIDYVHPAIEEVLSRTLGVPLFQEQCMALAVKAAGFTPGEADQLRRAMAAWKRKGDQIYRFGQKLISGMVANGIPLDFAQRCFEQIKGFSEYGFPESHAASFALLVYASAWMKRHYPAEFAAALINSQPMGFYAPAQLVRDAKAHGVEVRRVDVNHSAWDCTIEDGAMRLGMRIIKGMKEQDAQRLRAAVAQHGPFDTMMDLWRSSGAPAAALRRLASADAFASMSLTRQEALWNARLLRDDDLPLFDAVNESSEPKAVLPKVRPQRQVVLDYTSTGLSLKAHPVSFARERLDAMNVMECATLAEARLAPDGARVRVAGVVLVRQRPGTASGVTFITLEDETGIANLVVWRRVYERYRRQAGARLLVAHGRVQREGEVVHVVVTRMENLDHLLNGLGTMSRDFR